MRGSEVHLYCFAILSARCSGWALQLTHFRPHSGEGPHWQCLKPFWWCRSLDRKRLEVEEVNCRAEDQKQPDVKTRDLDEAEQNRSADILKKNKKKTEQLVMNLVQTPRTCKGVIRPREPRGCTRLVTKICTRHGWPIPTHLMPNGRPIALELGRSSGFLAAEEWSLFLCGLHGI